MKVVIAGSSGLIGTKLVAALRRNGHRVVRLVRRPVAGPDEHPWNPARGELDEQVLHGADAIVNLCGAGIGSRRWTGSYKQLLRDSRITPTDVLSGMAAAAGVPVLVNASGVHVYGGETGDRVVDEATPPGSGFLATMCRDWEAATRPATEAGIRTVLLRSAVVLSRSGGMLAKLGPLYRLGLGARLSNGHQYLPWVSLEDEIGAIRYAIAEEAVSGPINVVGPAPVTNAEFNRALGQAMHRPAPLVVPGFALRAAIGEFAREALLSGPRAIPSALEAAGYRFQHPTVGAALAASITEDR